MNSNMKYIKYILVIIFIIMVVVLYQSLIEEPPIVQEGFTTYFRQTIRPHVRRLGYMKDTVSYQFTKRFSDFGKGLGIL